MDDRARAWRRNDGLWLGVGSTLLGLALASVSSVGCVKAPSTSEPSVDESSREIDFASVSKDLTTGADLADSDLTVLPGDTVVRVHYPRNDARYSKMTLRGDGAGLSWTTGRTMTKAADGLFVTKLRGLTAMLEWKPLLDDATWSRGHNFVVLPGQTVDVYPHFVTAKGRYLRVDAVRSTVLGNTRGVWLYLPPSFDENPEARYPVLYMHDGQNLFDPRYAFGGRTWQVSQTLDAGIDALEPADSLPEVVVIGPENTDRRLYEYTPSKSSEPAYSDSGGGDAYLRFLTDELMPQMNNLEAPVKLKGRLLGDAAKTSLAGSSLGGLITAYAGIKKPDVFGRLGIFSPSTWWDGTFIIGAVKASVQKPSRVYIDSGNSGASGDDYRNTASLAQTYRDIGFRDGVSLNYVLEPGGVHNEDAWARRLPGALRFLLAGL